MFKGIIMHEFLHALGFYHQQSSADRDAYVEINTKNIKPGTEDNFYKYVNTEVTNFGYPYDFGSIMHYGPYDFSKNGYPTITSKLENIKAMGQRITLSTLDIAKLNKMYECKT